MTTAEMVLAAYIGLIVLIGAWRVTVRQDLTWAEYASLLVAVCVHPVHMVRAAFKRRPR